MIIRYAIMNDKNEKFTFWCNSKEEAINNFIKICPLDINIKKLKLAQQTTIIQKELEFEELTKKIKLKIRKGIKKYSKISNANYKNNRKVW